MSLSGGVNIADSFLALGEVRQRHSHTEHLRDNPQQTQLSGQLCSVTFSCRSGETLMVATKLKQTSKTQSCRCHWLRLCTEQRRQLFRASSLNAKVQIQYLAGRYEEGSSPSSCKGHPCHPPCTHHWGHTPQRWTQC